MFANYTKIILVTILLACGATSQLVRNTVFIIRGAETDVGSTKLSSLGASRASECIPNVFGNSSQHDIGLIISCNSDTSACQASLQTAEPLAQSLGLSINTSCGLDVSDKCVRDVISNFSSGSNKDILIVWDGGHLNNLLTGFGLRNVQKNQPSTIFVLRNNIFVSQLSQNCPGVDAAGGIGPKFSPTKTNSNHPDAQDTPIITSSPSPPRNTRLLNLYYTTTITYPDPAPTPTGTAILLKESKKKRGLHARERSSGYSYLVKKSKIFWSSA